LGFCIGPLNDSIFYFLFFIFYTELGWVTFLSSLGWPIRVSPFSNPKPAWAFKPYPNFQPINPANTSFTWEKFETLNPVPLLPFSSTLRRSSPSAHCHLM
jgi:hypothetical protein